MGLSLLVAGACFSIHPWVLNINYLRFEQFVHSDAAVFFISSVIFIESAVKGIFSLNEKTTPCQSRHWINRLLHSFFIYGGTLVRNTPSLMLGFFLFFSLSYCFHYSETTPFKLIATGIAGGLFLFLIIGSLALRFLLKGEQLRTAVFNLLFIQLVLAITLPLLGNDNNTLPVLYHKSINMQSALTGISMLAVALAGFVIYHFTNKRTNT